MTTRCACELVSLTYLSELGGQEAHEEAEERAQQAEVDIEEARHQLAEAQEHSRSLQTELDAERQARERAEAVAQLSKLSKKVGFCHILSP